MKRTFQLQLSPDIGMDEENLTDYVRNKAGWPDAHVRIIRRSIDARKRKVRINVQTEAWQNEEVPELISWKPDLPNVSRGPEVLIIGGGPAGLFAAVKLIEAGIKPVILERGKDVRARRRDLAAINKDHIVNPDSNYCFGEGGAGTYSDGKLYTRSKKRGSIQRILEILVAHGAPENILFESHPHIGTNKLPKIVTALRETIEATGGEVCFNTRVTDLEISGDEVKGVVLADGVKRRGEAVILATGHSARDIFEMLYRKHIPIEAKPFALGVRIEHPQALIDEIQYHCSGPRDSHLPASSYSLVHQAEYNGTQRGVFSFCMCPGGFIVPAATSPGEVVVNGMSPSRRNSRYANSGIVVAIEPQDWIKYEGPLGAMLFQQSIEQSACAIAGGTQSAPAQRMMDYVQGKVSTNLPDSSYQPGFSSVDLRDVLPKEVSVRLTRGLKHFGKVMKGYLTNEAVLVGVESRTSSPVTVPRNKTTLEHVSIARLYPCGEGGGYAGGIVSAAMDGERVADAIRTKFSMKV